MNTLKTLLVFAFGIFIALATPTYENYYVVAPTGSDNNPGTLDRPFKTVQKCASVIQPGKTCLLRAGIYRETVRPTSSGIAKKPITFEAYKNEKVTISGADVVEGWTPYRGSIFRTNVTLPVSAYKDTGFFANQVFVDGKMMTEARWPNNKYLNDPMLPTLAGCCVKSQGGNAATVENSDIPNIPEGWTGATVWTNEWYTTRTGTITGGTTKKLTAQMTAPWDRGGYWFYLVGKLGLLDRENEWFYDSKSRSLYLWALNGMRPSSVEVKQRNFAFDLSDRSYVVLRNLKLFASTITTSDTSQEIVLDGIHAKYVSHHITLPPLPKSEQAPNTDSPIVASHAHDTGIQLRGKGHTLKNSVVEWSSGNGVLLEGINHTVTNSIIANSNYMVSSAAPVRLNGSGHRITYNTIKRSSNAAIQIDWHTAGVEVHNVEIAYNDISSFGMRGTDVGAIGACCYINLESGSIHHNWIRDAKGFSPFWGTRGIYLDLESFNSTTHHNVVWNIINSKDNYSFAAGSPRGYNRAFNNTFLGPVFMDASIEARNNIFAASEKVAASQQSNNLFMESNPKFTQMATDAPKSADFTLQSDSPAVDRGIAIPGIADAFVGKAPDIGAYEYGAPIWKAGSKLEYEVEGEGIYD